MSTAEQDVRILADRAYDPSIARCATCDTFPNGNSAREAHGHPGTGLTLPKLHHWKCLSQQCPSGLHRTVLELAIAKFGSARRARYEVIPARTRQPDELATAAPRTFDIEADHGSLPLRWDGVRPSVAATIFRLWRSVNGEGRGLRTNKAAPAKLNGVERNISPFYGETL